jgi:hypothetical protein
VTTFYNQVLNEEERGRLVSNVAGHLKDAKDFIQKRAVSVFSVSQSWVYLGVEMSNKWIWGHWPGHASVHSFTINFYWSTHVKSSSLSLYNKNIFLGEKLFTSEP